MSKPTHSKMWFVDNKVSTRRPQNTTCPSSRPFQPKLFTRRTWDGFRIPRVSKKNKLCKSCCHLQSHYSHQVQLDLLYRQSKFQNSSRSTKRKIKWWWNWTRILKACLKKTNQVVLSLCSKKRSKNKKAMLKLFTRSRRCWLSTTKFSNLKHSNTFSSLLVLMQTSPLEGKKLSNLSIKGLKKWKPTQTAGSTNWSSWTIVCPTKMALRQQLKSLTISEDLRLTLQSTRTGPTCAVWVHTLTNHLLREPRAWEFKTTCLNPHRFLNFSS